MVINIKSTLKWLKEYIEYSMYEFKSSCYLHNNKSTIIKLLLLRGDSYEMVKYKSEIK